MTTQPTGETTVGPYTLLTRLGEGGMGVVHLARRGTDGQRVALKVLRHHIVGDDEARRRLAREVSSLSRVRSRWVAEIIDADPWGDVPYVATRYVPGLSLHDHVHSEGAQQGADLTWLAACLAEGVASVHAVGVLHRDVKPANVLMEGRTPILIDFGLARVADDPKLTHTGWLLGTPGYLAPEILYGDDATPAADVHSWASTVAFAGTGRPPFGRGPSMAIMDRVRRGEHDLRGLPGPLAELVADALDPEPERRPGFDEILAWLRPQTNLPAPVPAAPPVTDVIDAFTLPIAGTYRRPAPAGRTEAEATTTVVPSGPEPAAATLVDPAGVTPTVVERPTPPPSYVAPEAPTQQPFQPPLGPPWPVEEPAPPPPSLGERVRRTTLAGAVLVLVAALLALAPWVTLVVVALLVWLLRSGSLAVEAVGHRRRLRGRKWYDGVLLLVHAPWRAVQAVPGTLLLLAWSAGLTAAAGLVCYAAASTVTTAVVVCGVVLTGALWWGPGSARLRSPIARGLQPVARTAGWWMIGVGTLLVLALVAGLVVAGHGVSWTPYTHRPFASTHR